MEGMGERAREKGDIPEKQTERVRWNARQTHIQEKAEEKLQDSATERDSEGEDKEKGTQGSEWERGTERQKYERPRKKGWGHAGKKESKHT